MRNPRRNQTLIHYALLTDAGTDRWGNPIKEYGDAKELYISLSAEKGETSNEVFGQDVDYTREMVTTDTDCPIDEYSHLWIGIDVDKPYNYEVKRVARSINQKRYAIKEVTRSYDHNS